MTSDEIRDQLRLTFFNAGFRGDQLDKMVEIGVHELLDPRVNTTDAGPVRCPNCDDWMDARVLDTGVLMLCQSCGYREAR